jgi:transcriptional regulator with XRE-family HTH domain
MAKDMSLVEWREKERMTRPQAAEHLGLEISYYWKLEQGKVWPKPERMATITTATGGAVSANAMLNMWMMANA